MTANPDLPLAGLRVLDMTTVVLGPFAAQMLGDLGADVIKIEAPGGDMTRVVGARRSDKMASLYLGSNRNKRSIELDLKRAAPKAALWRLLENADIFLHNVRPQKIARLGFDPDSVLARNPKIIYCALHGYGEAGPYAGRPAYDDIIQGESGLAGTFERREGSPMLVPSIVADKTTALLATTGLLAAYIKRLRTGNGLYLETSMFEGLVGYTLVEHQHGTIFNPPEGPPGYPRALSPQRKPFATKDGFICVLAYTDTQWRSFWDIAGITDLQHDARFATMAARADNIDVAYEYVAAELHKHPSAFWLDRLRTADIPCGPVNRLEDLRNDPHLKAAGFFRPFSHPTEGEMEIPETGLRFDRQPLPVRRHHPGLGEHSREILTEAGFSDAEIDEILD